MNAGRTFGLFLVLAAALPASALGQDGCVSVSRASEARTWAPPLDRPITLQLRSSLRDALTRVAGAAQIRLSYSAEALPLERPLCAAFDAMPVGAALAALLGRASVNLVVVGGDHVVLAPRPRATAQELGVGTSEPVVRLSPVVVDGTRSHPEARVLPTSTTVLDGRALERMGTTDIADAMNGAAPGVWVWQPSAASLSVQYASLRGASSFGVNYPKVYIDGIEIANPLLLTRFTPEAVDRIELIRGPGGASLYGGDAIAGVTNIITRNAYEPAAARAFVRSDIGFAVSQFNKGASVAHDHSFSLRGGSPELSGGFNLSVGTEGDVVARGNAEHAAADASVRLMRDETVITGTLRWLSQSAANPFSPLLSDSIDKYAGITAVEPQSMRQFTAGIQARFRPNDRWTHSLVAGVDGYSVGLHNEEWLGLLTPADSALRAATQGSRITFRAMSARQFTISRLGHGELTFSGDHSELRQSGEIDELTQFQVQPRTLHARGRRIAPQHSYDPAPPADNTTTISVQTVPQFLMQRTAGLSSHLNFTLLNQFVLTGGLRLERQHSLGVAPSYARLPSAALSWIVSSGPSSARLRTAYSQGVRWPRYTSPTDAIAGAVANLGPERQSGIEVGADFMLGRALTLQLTRFDQTASDLIQRIVLPGADLSRTQLGRGVGFELQNVGEITNGGWEMLARVDRGPLSVTGSLALVNSRVQQVAPRYTGDLRAGDRMLGVPAKTMSFAVSWIEEGWSAALTASRATNWINYDRLALARAITESSSTEPPQFTGTELRTFWRAYEGITHLQANFSRELNRGLALYFSAENLLNRQVGEPDNITVLTGRTISLGVRASF